MAVKAEWRPEVADKKVICRHQLSRLCPIKQSSLAAAEMLALAVCMFDCVVFTLQIQFSIQSPGPDQWIFMVNGQPQFKLDLFSMQRPLAVNCTDVQLGCSYQQALQPRSMVLSCTSLQVNVLNIASSCLVLDVIKVSTIPSVCTPSVHY